MDKTNKEILAILQEKARIPNVEVSRKINLAPSAVLERIRKMEQQGIIEGYEVRLNAEHFSCSQVSFVFITVKPGASLSAIEQALVQIDQIQELHFISGEDCYLVKMRTADLSELDHLVRVSVLNIPGIQATRSLPVLATQKETAHIPLRRI